MTHHKFYFPGGTRWENEEGQLDDPAPDIAALQYENGDRHFYKNGIMTVSELVSGVHIDHRIDLTNTEIKETKGSTIMSVKEIAMEATAAAMEGMKLAAANEFNELAADLLVEAAKAADIPEDVLNSEIGRTILKFMAPVVLMSLCEYFPHYVPGAAVIREGSKKAIAVNTMQTIAPMMAKLRPNFQKLHDAAVSLDQASKGQLSAAAPTADTVEQTLNMAKKVKVNA